MYFYCSIVDQQQKQAIPFVGGQIIGNYDGHIYVCSPNGLNALIPIPWEKQVEVSLEIILSVFTQINLNSCNPVFINCSLLIGAFDG